MGREIFAGEIVVSGTRYFVSIDNTTYNDHPNTLIINFCVDAGVPSRLVVNIDIREKEVIISFPLSLFVYYDRITSATGRALGYWIDPIVAGCSHPDDDPINWRENNMRCMGCNSTGNGRCHVLASIRGPILE
jgi:hypothetical protein